MRAIRDLVCSVVLISVLGFLLLPIAVILLVSLSNNALFALPDGVGALSLRWYLSVWDLDSFWQALLTSALVALAATSISLALGVPSAFALSRGRFVGRQAVFTFLVSPLMLPGLVLGIALLFWLRGLGLQNALVGLLIAHVVVTLPFIVRAVSASLALFDDRLIDAARTLGCSYPQALRRALIPNIAPGVLTGAMFAFVASFENYSVSLFLTDVQTKTLPIQVLTYLEQSPDPSVAAISMVTIAVAILFLVAAERLVGVGGLTRF